MSRGAVYHYFKTKEDIINASSPEVEPVAEILDLLDQGDLNQAEHDIPELLGEEAPHLTWETPPRSACAVTSCLA